MGEEAQAYKRQTRGIIGALGLRNRTREVAQDPLEGQKNILHRLPLACAVAVEVMLATILTLTDCHIVKQYVTSTMGENRGLLVSWGISPGRRFNLGGRM